MKVLLHVATDMEGNPLTAAFVDGNGKKWTVPGGEPTEFENEFMASKIMEHCHYYGIVEVAQTRTGKGIEYDLEDAEARAGEALLRSEKNCINDYVKTQLESRVKQNVPPLPPEGRALECVVKHRYNLKKAGLHVVGWEPPYSMESQEADGSYHYDQQEVDQRIKALENENEKLRDELRQFMRQFTATQARAKGPQIKLKDHQKQAAGVEVESHNVG
jgi:hypothetical protein